MSWKPKTETSQSNGLSFAHNMCNKHDTLPSVKLAAGNDLHLWDVFDFKRSETLETPILLRNFFTISSLHRHEKGKVFSLQAYMA
jgi:hypothetical protein